MESRTLLEGILILGILGGCSKPAEPGVSTGGGEASEPVASAQAGEEGPGTTLEAPAAEAAETEPVVFSYLETRDHEITLWVGGLYSVATKDGKVLADRIDAAQLQKDFPDVHELIRGAVDVNEGGARFFGVGYDD